MAAKRTVAAAAAAVVMIGSVAVALPARAQPTAAHGTSCAASGAVHLHPGDAIQRAVRRTKIGTVVCFSRGTYRLRTPILPDGQIFIGQHAVLSGARVLHFSRDGGQWSAPEFHANGQRNGQCLPETTTVCTYPNDVLRDGVPMRRVLHAPVKPRQYEVDYGANRVRLAAAPGKHRFEIEVSPAAFQAITGDTGRGVTVRGFTIRNFASPAQHGAIDTAQTGWTIEHNTVEENHGAGISTGSQAHLLHNRVRYNGEEGIAGDGRHIVVARNNVSYNNFQRRFDPDWEAGGCKWAEATHLRVRHNLVHNNYGPGLWDDIDSNDVTYTANRVVLNAYAGIFHEIGGAATIESNVAVANGRGKPAWLWGAGILVAASHNVDVANNLLRVNAEGIGLVQQDRGVSERDGSLRVLSNVNVHDNRVYLGGGTTGLVEDNGDTALFSDPTLSWTDNQYWGVRGKAFEWNDTELSANQWRGVGHDVHGTFHP